MKCSDCKNFHDRYVLYVDGTFPDVQELLDKGLIDSKDFMCEGYGCIFQPCRDFTNAGDDTFMHIPFSDLPNNMENLCKNFEPRKKNERILVKKLSLNPIKDHINKVL